MAAARGEPGEARFLPASDRTLLVSFGESIGPGPHPEILRLLRRLDGDPLPGVTDLTPAYSSLLVRFDPLRTDHAAIEAGLRAGLRELARVRLPSPRRVEIPVCYGGAFGPDLEQAARERGLDAAQAAALHSGTIYRACFLGFVAGFAYLGEVPEAIAFPRLPAPRRVVPAGSVGVAGRQTGVYPAATPGGWRIIGRTPIRLFDPRRDPMARIAIGDEVRFVPIPPARYEQMEEK
jgi:inhibitor of KinA